MVFVKHSAVLSMRAVVAMVLVFGVLLVSATAADAAPPVLAPGGTLTVPGGALNFGNAVGISGNTAIVGAPDNGTVPGTTYIYVKPKNGAWPAAPSFTLPDPAHTPGDTFGDAVAISGGYAVVGAAGTSSLTGAAYIYKRTGQVWSTTPTATLSSPSAPGNQFGISVAISGTTAVVGTGNYAPDGAAFVYQKAGIAWPLASTLTDSSANPHWGFGEPVAISSNTVVVSAYGAQTGSCTTPPCGAVDIYVKPGNGWALSTSTPTARLSDPAGDENDYFGNSIAISGRTILSGDYNSYPPASGPVYIFVRPPNGWISTATATQTLLDPAPNTNDSFGLSLAISGGTAIVGAYSASSLAGNAYVYKKTAGWPTVPTVSKNPWPVPAGAGNFGISVAISGGTAIVGASAGSGDSYIFNGA